ncbi:hypothetical protein ACJX0J_008740, partial [Zea mays]
MARPAQAGGPSNDGAPRPAHAGGGQIDRLWCLVLLGEVVVGRVHPYFSDGYLITKNGKKIQHEHIFLVTIITHRKLSCIKDDSFLHLDPDIQMHANYLFISPSTHIGLSCFTMISIIIF